MEKWSEMIWKCLDIPPVRSRLATDGLIPRKIQTEVFDGNENTVSDVPVIVKEEANEHLGLSSSSSS